MGSGVSGFDKALQESVVVIHFSQGPSRKLNRIKYF